MDLSNVLAINEKPGLYKLITKNKSSFIVESLLDQKRFPAFSHDGISSLDNIAIYTTEEDVFIEKIFEMIYVKENGASIQNIFNDNAKMKSYFEAVLPNYDKERVYVSNIKKVLLWYNILVENNILTQEAIDQANNQEENKESKGDGEVAP